jgi:hypothetical protein
VAAPSPAAASAPEGNQAQVLRDAQVKAQRARKGLLLKEKLKGLSKEERLKFWQRKAPREEKSKVVGVLLVTYNLDNKGRESPIIAWKDILECLDCPKPLFISVVGAKLAECYFDEKHVASAREALSKGGVLVEHRVLTQADVTRRAGVYVRGFFPPFRQAALQGLDKALRQEVLRVAEESAAKVVGDKARKDLLKQLQVDKGLLAMEDPVKTDAEEASG